jgi:hypothetical protein
VDADCRAVIDPTNSCDCGYPFAASVVDLENNPCLIPWGQRDELVPPECLPRPGQVCLDIPCPAWPGCAGAACVEGKCNLHDGYEGECTVAPEECPAVFERLQNAIDAALLCDPTISSISCSGAAGVRDQCGCPIILNERNPDLLQLAHDARNALDASGCVIACPPVACPQPTSGTCSSDGVCAPL